MTPASQQALALLQQDPRVFAHALHLYVDTPSRSPYRLKSSAFCKAQIAGHCLSVVALDPAQLRRIPPA